MEFEARLGEEFPKVNIAFGQEADVRAISRWRARKNSPSSVHDALEFARLASKRWRYYRHSIPSIASISQFEREIRSSSNIELSFILLAQADWFSAKTPLGLAQCRRTFCHHIILEFLAVHPRILLPANPRVRGIGAGLVGGICALAEHLHVPLIWGEATAFSAPFYQNVFNLRDVNDHFFVNQTRVANSAARFRKEVAGRLFLENVVSPTDSSSRDAERKNPPI